MRLFLVGLFLVLYFILSLPWLLVEWIIGKFNKPLSVRTSQAFVAFNFKIILFLSGVKLTVKGTERIPRDTPVLFVSNHRSYFDILVSYVTLPVPAGFVAKKEMEKIPFLSWWMRMINCLFLDRDNIKEGLKTILKGIDLIKDGYSIFIAPEGTRSQTNEMLPFKEGSFKMAEKTGCPVVPVAITNTDAVFERHLPWIRKAHVVIEYCDPVPTAELTREEKKALCSNVQEIIRQKLIANESLI